MAKTKEERAEYMRQYYQNPEAVERRRQKDRERYLRDPKAAIDRQSAYYQANKEKVLARVRRNGKLRRDKLREEAIVKLGGACLDCGEKDRRLLQFHHRPEEIKVAEVSSLSGSKQKYWAEVNKCDLLCANHHLIRQDEGR